MNARDTRAAGFFRRRRYNRRFIEREQKNSRCRRLLQKMQNKEFSLTAQAIV